jgi:ADP-ribose pyrophosphatase YjhB (NUDIX family)
MGTAIGVLVCLLAASALYSFYWLDKRDARKRNPYGYIYCPKCAGRLVMGDIGGKEKLHCSRCNFVLWDNPRPKAKTIIPTVDGRIVLVHGLSGGWELPGGYLEPFETLIDGAKRETFEETHLRVEILREFRMVMPPKHNEHEHFFLCAPVREEPEKGDDADDARAFAIKDIPWDEIKVPWHKEILADWIEDCKRC